MIILDTNIVSEFMAPSAHPLVIDWLNKQVITRLCVTSITIAEVNYGLEVMPTGKRQAALRRAFNLFIERSFTARILPFDEPAAVRYGSIRAQRKALGRPIAVLDAQIAAIAKSREFTLATRNTKDFIACDIALINPFESIN